MPKASTYWNFGPKLVPRSNQTVHVCREYHHNAVGAEAHSRVTSPRLLPRGIVVGGTHGMPRFIRLSGQSRMAIGRFLCMSTRMVTAGHDCTAANPGGSRVRPALCWLHDIPCRCRPQVLEARAQELSLLHSCGLLHRWADAAAR